MKKILIIVGFVVIVLVILQFVYKKNRLVLVPSINEIDVYSDIELKDIVGVDVDNYKIDTSVVGNKELDVIYKNKIFKYKDKININIVDKISPTILVRDLTIEKNSDVDLVNSFLCGDNYDIKPNCYIEGIYDVSVSGTYNLKYVAVDSSNNMTVKSFNLNVVDEFKKVKQEETFIDFKDVIKRFKSSSTKIGIDVSKWQGNIDFEEVKKQGCEFVIIKAGGSYIDGELYTDPRFKENIESAIKNGLQVGVYLYSNSNSIERTQKEIDYLLDLIKDYDVEFVSYDWENFGDFNSYDINIHTLNEMANVFLEKAKDNNYKPLLYSSKYYLENIWDKNFNIWVAQYADNNTYNGDYKIWQHCSDGRIQGIDAYVDIDIMYN